MVNLRFVLFDTMVIKSFAILLSLFFICVADGITHQRDGMHLTQCDIYRSYISMFAVDALLVLRRQVTNRDRYAKGIIEP